MRQILRAEIQNLDRSEVLNMVDRNTLDKIKISDPNPELRVFAVGHEGQATPNMIGVGAKVLNCLKRAVQMLTEKLSIGTPVFNGHVAGTNSHEGRVKIGEVVGKAIREIGDKLYSLAVVHLNPSFRNQVYDIASVEADVQFSQDGREAWIEAIENVTGVALGHSAIDRPGFPGATLLGCIQAFAERTGTMNKDEIIAAVKSGGFKVSDVFEVEEIFKDSKVSDRVKDEKRDLYQQNKRIEKELIEERDAHTKTKNDFETQLNKLRGEATQAKATGVLDTLIAERKLDDRQTAYIRKGFNTFDTKATDENGLKTDLNKFLDAGLEDYRKTAEIFGVKLEPQGDANKTGDGNKGGSGKGSGEGSGDKAKSQGNEYGNPGTNDFIPKVG